MKARLYVDFNEMIEENLVLLSKTDFKIDSNGETIELKEGMTVEIYMDDENERNEKDNLVATGIVELNTEKDSKIILPKISLWALRFHRLHLKENQKN